MRKGIPIIWHLEYKRGISHYVRINNTIVCECSNVLAYVAARELSFTK